MRQQNKIMNQEVKMDPPEQASRTERRRLETRARLVNAAHSVMCEKGVDSATIQEITELADVGFGTFYNYFTSKNDLASQVLDCVINDLGKRNDIATSALKVTDPAKVMPVSVRLVLQEALHNSMWKWWVLRPDLLVDRMRIGFKPFAIRDIRIAADQGFYSVANNDYESAWHMAVWMMVGCLRDMVTGQTDDKSEPFMIEAILRVMGVPSTTAHTLARDHLPDYPKSKVDFMFQL